MADEIQLAAATPPSRPRRPSPTGVRPGRLIIVGSGIRAVGQFTLEAQGHIKEANKVFYCVANPVTERWIEEQNPNAYDLYRLYGNDKPRQITYTQMAEILLAHVRQGYRVVGVFYGHPGVFVNPSHRAVAIAREEGHHAIMLAGVSAEDCLYADLGIDPSRVGCQVLEATDLLLRRRTLLPDSHVILFQVGSVGDMGFNFGGFANRNFGVLVDHLEEVYGADHKLTHYVAPQYPAAGAGGAALEDL